MAKKSKKTDESEEQDRFAGYSEIKREADLQDAILGHSYRDKVTGWTGVATSKTTFLNGCIRIGLERIDKGEVKGEVFDVQRLIELAEPRVDVTPRQTGGARDTPTARPGANSR